MSDLRHKGDWQEVKQKLMDKYPILTERDFENENDNEKLLNHLEDRLGIESDEIRDIIRKM